MAYWTLLISAFCCVGISALTGKGYYCRDPDTGKLYPVNSTWPSTSFCGNYSCKLRKKDITKSVIPIRDIMIDSLPQSTQTRSIEENSIHTEATPDIPSSTILSTLYSKFATKSPIRNSSEVNNQQKVDSNNVEIKPVSNENGDRYLTDSEIKTISHLLHNVKKSDLEAIVDVYNLAQDIYKEMDKITNENILEETIKAVKTTQTDTTGGKRYWYEPLNRLSKAGIGADMETQGSHMYPTAVERSTVDPNSYFQGPLSKTDFGVLPYYYSMSNFQREHSYQHPNRNLHSYPPKYEKPPCAQSTQYPYYPVTEPPKVYQPPAPSYYPYQSYGSVIKKAFPVDTQKVIQPSVLLPYPFSYIQHYNMSNPYNSYYNSGSWPYYDKNNFSYDQYFKANLPQSHKSVEVQIETEPSFKASKDNALNENTEVENHPSYKEVKTNNDNEDKSHHTNKDDGEKSEQGEIKKNLLESFFEQTKLENKIKPDWQTDPLATSVLEEIRAHFEDKARLIKPFSLRKKAKLERVGKVVKLDDLNRDKRSVNDSVNTDEVAEEGLEVYVEKTTCPSQVDLGFYKMGNLTQPYPACCPRRIENNER
ncbi:hypothetical protein evm_007306 [Chilo suppressalis]|nr:hypothetical protein evm_007306 [Chilo suppressalis]